MTRTRVRLVPQGIIPRPIDLGVRLTPKAAPAAAAAECPCVPVWDGWAIVVDGDPASGTPIFLQNEIEDPIVIRVELLGELCPDQCIEWDLRAVRDALAVLSDDVTVTPDACEAVDIVFGHSVLARYADFVSALYATVDGAPFGEAIIFVTGSPDTPCTEARDVQEGWWSVIDGDTPPSQNSVQFNPGATFGTPSLFPNTAFTLDIADAAFFPGTIDTCGSNMSAAMIFAGGDPSAYGDFILSSWADLSTGDVGFRLSADGSHDYTDIQIQLFPFWVIDSAPYGSGFTVSAL